VQIISPQGDESIATIGYPASSTPAVKTDDRKFFQIVCPFLYLESKMFEKSLFFFSCFSRSRCLDINAIVC